jgi:hypothetical protein
MLQVKPEAPTLVAQFDMGPARARETNPSQETRQAKEKLLKRFFLR